MYRFVYSCTRLYIRKVAACEIITLEQELIHRFAQLDLETKQRLLAQVETEDDDFELLMQEMDEFREGLLVKYGAGHFMSVVDIIQEVRK